MPTSVSERTRERLRRLVLVQESFGSFLDYTGLARAARDLYDAALTDGVQPEEAAVVLVRDGPNGQRRYDARSVFSLATAELSAGVEVTLELPLGGPRAERVVSYVTNCGQYRPPEPSSADVAAWYIGQADNRTSHT